MMNPRRPRFSARPGQFRKQARGKTPPMLMGEPSPSLAKISAMNMAKLEAKIADIDREQAQLAARLEKLKAYHTPPEAKIKAISDLQVRLDALRQAAANRLAGKAERKAAREQRGR
jgi:predicted component of type VI protein secretion system